MVNGLGNLTARVMKLAETNLEAPVELGDTDTMISARFTNAITEFRFNDALDFIFQRIAKSDAFMTEQEPFKKVKSDGTEVVQEGKENIAELVRQLANIATHLSAVMPITSATILDAIRANKKPENLFPRLA